MFFPALSLLLLPSVTLAAFNLNTTDFWGEGDVVDHIGSSNPACLAAYNATIDCDFDIVNVTFSEDNLPTEGFLDRVCTSTCLASLEKWIRGGEGCEGADFLGYYQGGIDTFFGRNLTTAEIQQYVITTVYHQKCLTNLNPKSGESKYCALKLLPSSSADASQSYYPGYYNSSAPDAFCKENSCATQSAYLWAPLNVTYLIDSISTDENSEAQTISLADACPGIDTSKYPRREQDLTTADLNGSGNTSKPNAAATSIASLSIMFSVVFAAVSYIVL